ncbi:MAG: hypothetical protein RLZ39_1053 [Bacteroidota bacterium]
MLLINFTPIQKILVDKATAYLSKKLNTAIHIDYISLSFLYQIKIEGLQIKDRSNNNLLQIGLANVNFNNWFIFKDKLVLKYISIKNVRVNTYRTIQNNQWNYSFIEDALTSNTTNKKNRNGFELSIQKIQLERINYSEEDAWVGSNMYVSIGKGAIDIDTFNETKRKITIKDINFSEPSIELKDYPASPFRPKNNFSKQIDTSCFNKGNWQVAIKQIKVANGIFKLNYNNKQPIINEFDAEHMDINHINLLIKNTTILKDTIKGSISYLNAKERCGLQLKQFKCNVIVSPNKTICNQLYIATNNSEIGDYYAMYYKRFPDFLDYMQAVIMTANFKNAKIDLKDVAYFSRNVAVIPYQLTVNTNFKGTVSKFKATATDIKAPYVQFKGNISIDGLPNWEESILQIENAKLNVDKKGLDYYAPNLAKESPIKFSTLGNFNIEGSFNGKINHFATNNKIATAIGNAQINLEINIPEEKDKLTVYSGTINGENIDIGALLNNKEFGKVDANLKVKGEGFDINNADIYLDGNLDKFEFKNYAYKQILIKGSLDQKVFKGNLIVDDENLALSFNGEFDFANEKKHINALANLLHADFQKIGLSKEPFNGNADFDLNLYGSNINDLEGTAQLNNIDLKRGKEKLNIDFIQLHSKIASAINHEINIESNDFKLGIKGLFKVENIIDASKQYLYKYLPSYISKSKYNGEAQNFSFNIATKKIDKLIHLVNRDLDGFNNTIIEGSINTNEKQLLLNGTIPFCKINAIRINKAEFHGIGNLENLSLSSNIQQLMLGDTLWNTQVQLATNIQNDSIHCELKTNSFNRFGNANIAADIITKLDTISVNFSNSNFYINNSIWNITNSKKIKITADKLFVNELKLKSNNQTIAINSIDNNENTLEIKINDLDLSQIGTLAQQEYYQPYGHLNAQLSIDNPITNPTTKGLVTIDSTTIKNETLGKLNASFKINENGWEVYEGSGISNDNNALQFNGSSLNNQLNATIKCINTPLKWASIFMSDYISDIDGQTNGTIKINGSSEKPTMKGSLSLIETKTKVIYLGTYYTIPLATINFEDNKIDLGKIALYDRFKNKAIATGSITHSNLSNFYFKNIEINSNQIEAINLSSYENDIFYGNAITKVNTSINGPIDDITMNVIASPAQASHIYLPFGNTAVYNYNFINFKTPQNEPSILKKKNASKFALNITAITNPLAEITMILDAKTGDQISGYGNGTININVPADNDVKIYNTFEIISGYYKFSINNFIKPWNFKINNGSKVTFNGPITKINLDINASYTTKARLYDLLNENEKKPGVIPENELTDTKAKQNIDVKLRLDGTFEEPKPSYKIELQDKRLQGTYAYNKLERINLSPESLFNQVASLLLIEQFMPPEGIVNTASASSTAITSVGEKLSSTVSSQLTNWANKILGDPNLAINLNYKNYNVNTDNTSSSAIYRNEVKLNAKRNFMQDRLMLEIEGAYDWGNAAMQQNTNSNINLTGDFRGQYKLTEDGRIRMSIFRNSNYDVLIDRPISRSGIGLSWSKSFNSLADLWKSKQSKRLPANDSATILESN